MPRRLPHNSAEEVNMFVVTGATGRTGRLVAQGLLAHGAGVRVVLRDGAAREAWLAAGAEAVVAPFTDEAALAAAFAGASGAYLLLPEDGSVDDFAGHRRHMADAIAAAAAASRVPHVVLLSGAGAVVSDGNGPAAELARLERRLREGVAQVTAIRACGFHENVLGVRALAARDGVYPSFFAALDAPFPSVATADVARLATRCLLRPPAAHEIVDLVGPALTVRGIARDLGIAVGRALRVVVVPPAAHVAALEAAGLRRAHAESVAELFACLASGRVTPRGDRLVAGELTLPEVLAAAGSRA